MTSGAASFQPPGVNEGHSEFVSDPANPVPYTAKGTVFPGPLYMVEDQRFLEGRPDVLSFVTEPLQEDLVLVILDLPGAQVCSTGRVVRPVQPVLNLSARGRLTRPPARKRSRARQPRFVSAACCSLTSLL